MRVDFNMSKKTETKQRSQFATRLGVIAVTVGSSVGLGNIWRFPYEAGTHGGAAFILCYVAFIILMGVPVICAEFVLGRQSRSNFFGCFKRLGARKAWSSLGIIGIASSVLIISFYSVVAGWTLEYLWQSITGSLYGGTGGEAAYASAFREFSSHSWRPIVWTVLFLVINHLVVRGGVQRGIERISNILMPLLFVILVALSINSLFMPGTARALQFLFNPDFGALTPSVILSALGQAFFSLSIGLGCMLTYASYFSDKTPLLRNAGITAGLDTLVAVLAGVLIFPVVFTYGMQPTAGPTLVFEVLPTIFGTMPGGVLVSILFFLMLVVASLTSTISMSEISIAYLQDERRISRRKACAISTLVALVGGVLCTMSFSGISDIHIGNFTIDFFDVCNDLSSNVLLPLGGMFISVYAGWLLDKNIFRSQLTNAGTLRHVPVSAIRFLLRYLCPVAILVIFVAQFIG